MPPRTPATSIAGRIQAPVLAPGGERHAAAGDGAHGELALGADVPDIGAEADGEADRDHDQRRRLHAELGQAVAGSSSGETKKLISAWNGL